MSTTLSINKIHLRFWEVALTDNFVRWTLRKVICHYIRQRGSTADGSVLGVCEICKASLYNNCVTRPSSTERRRIFTIKAIPLWRSFVSALTLFQNHSFLNYVFKFSLEKCVPLVSQLQPYGDPDPPSISS
jgi:hypothetical protein